MGGIQQRLKKLTLSGLLGLAFPQSAFRFLQSFDIVTDSQYLSNIPLRVEDGPIGPVDPYPPPVSADILVHVADELSWVREDISDQSGQIRASGLPMRK